MRSLQGPWMKSSHAARSVIFRPRSYDSRTTFKALSLLSHDVSLVATILCGGADGARMGTLQGLGFWIYIGMRWQGSPLRLIKLTLLPRKAYDHIGFRVKRTQVGRAQQSGHKWCTCRGNIERDCFAARRLLLASRSCFREGP